MADSGRKSTIYDIAQIAGASPSTGSAALSDNWRARRISEAKVENIRRIAEEQGFSVNMQARGLRRARSGMVGLIIPVHDDRYFSSMSQSVEVLARERGLVPVIASSMRNADEELRLAKLYLVFDEYLFVAGAADPDAISTACAGANLRHVFVDHPGRKAPSVISDNYLDATLLTRRVLEDLPQTGDAARQHSYFLGGIRIDYATSRRIEGFAMFWLNPAFLLRHRKLSRPDIPPTKPKKKLPASAKRSVVCQPNCLSIR